MSEQQQKTPLSPYIGGEREYEDGETLAQAIQEEPSRLQNRLDITTVLEGMQRGVLVSLRISRPRFSVAVARRSKTSSEMPGIEKLGLTLSEEGQRILHDYFSLGRHSLMPRQWQEDLNTAEVSARRCLAEFSLKTHWGAFMPSAQYQRWKEANERYEQQFWDLRDRILLEYDEMRASVEADYRRLAEDAWAHATFGRVALQAHGGTPSQTMLNDLREKLSEQDTHDEFVDRYMSSIESLIPSQQELADAFEYETELGYIPLPAHLARTQLTDTQAREQLLQEEAARAELEVIEAKRRSELEVVQEEQQAAQEITRVKLRNELAQAAMDRDVLEKARAQKEQLVAEFHADVVGYVNARIAQVCARTRESLEKNAGMLRGPISDSLRDLVSWMENLNIVEDEQLEAQILKLREALPSQQERDSARKGIARIDTSRIKRVVEELEEAAEQTLLELELAQAPRTRRGMALDQDTLLVDEPRRSIRPQEAALPATGLASSRRSRRKQ